MAEFCLDCWNKLHGTKLTEHNVLLSTPEEEVCENCRQQRPVVVRTRGPGVFFRALYWRIRTVFGR